MTYQNNTPATGGTSASLQNVKDDLRTLKSDAGTLKSDVVDLGVQVKEEGKKRLDETATQVQDKVAQLKTAGNNELEQVRGYIVENPGKSIMAAFAAGMILTLMSGRR